MNISEKIAETIFCVAEKENALLSNLANDGIFFMPELAFAYECGKAIMSRSKDIFGTQSPKWIREIDIGNGGPTDLLFELPNEERIAIEFKIRDTSTSYKSDVNKLARITDSKTTKLFCALIDVFDTDKPDDGRQWEVEENSGVSVISILKKDFPTKQTRYSSPVTCYACIWQVTQ